jgi:hypothetical protein
MVVFGESQSTYGIKHEFTNQSLEVNIFILKKKFLPFVVFCKRFIVIMWMSLIKSEIEGQYIELYWTKIEFDYQI